MQHPAGTSGLLMSDDTAAMLRSLVSDGVITGFDLSESSSGASVLTVYAPRGSSAAETEQAVKASITESWHVSALPAGSE